jgi:hypothetical protein
MKLTLDQLDAVGEVFNVAIGAGISAVGAAISQRLVRRELASDGFDIEMLRLSLTQHVGLSGDVFMLPCVGQLGGSMSMVFRKNGAHKAASLASGLSPDDLSLSVEQGRAKAGELMAGFGKSATPVLAKMLRLEFQTEPVRHVTCASAVEALCTTFPPSLSRRARDYAAIVEPFMTADGGISGLSLGVFDSSAMLPMLRSARLAA